MSGSNVTTPVVKNSAGASILLDRYFAAGIAVMAGAQSSDGAFCWISGQSSDIDPMTLSELMGGALNESGLPWEGAGDDLERTVFEFDEEDLVMHRVSPALVVATVIPRGTEVEAVEQQLLPILPDLRKFL